MPHVWRKQPPVKNHGVQWGFMIVNAWPQKQLEAPSGTYVTNLSYIICTCVCYSFALQWTVHTIKGPRLNRGGIPTHNKKATWSRLMRRDCGMESRVGRGMIPQAVHYTENTAESNVKFQHASQHQSGSSNPKINDCICRTPICI